MTRTEIIEAVKAKMDEVHPLDAGVTIVDPQIDKQLDQAAKSLLGMLPVSLCDPIKGGPGSTNFENYPFEIDKKERYTEIKCPDNFYRLYMLRLKGWHKGITSLLPPNSYIRRTTSRTPYGIYYNAGGDQYIKCYPPSAEVEDFLFIAEPGAAETLDDGLLEFLAWHTASVVFSIAGQDKEAQSCSVRLMETIAARTPHVAAPMIKSNVTIRGM